MKLPPERRPLLFTVLAGILVAAFFLQSFLSSRVKTPAWDETGDVAAAVSYIQTGDFTVNLQHPPLVKELAGLSLYLQGARYPSTSQARQLLDGASQYQWTVGNQIINAYGADQVMFWARLPLILVAAGLGVLLYVWGRQMLGPIAGLGALLLYALDPTIVAHSYLVTMDVGLAAFTILFLFALWHYLRYPSLRRLLWCGLALGAVLATKFSALFMLPVGGLLIFAAACRPPVKTAGRISRFLNLYGGGVEGAPRAAPNDPCPCGSGKKFKKCHGAEGLSRPAGRTFVRKLAVSVGVFAAMCAAAWLALEVVYFFHDALSLYAQGMSLVNRDHNPNYAMLLAGSLDQRFLSYFAVAWLLKEPAAAIVLAVLGLVVLLRSKELPLVDKLFLLLPPVVLFLAHTFLADDLGFRYVIPVLPFAYLLGGLALAALVRSGSAWKRAVAAVLCAWVVLAAIGIYPDHLSYFNEAACLLQDPARIGLDGGTRCGPRWLDDSNVDWGEGLKQLRGWLDQHAPGRSVRLGYFGTFPPETYLPDVEKLDLKDLLPQPKPGLYAVSAHLVARTPVIGEKYFDGAGAWLWQTPPLAIVGHCLYVYDIQ